MPAPAAAGWSSCTATSPACAARARQDRIVASWEDGGDEPPRCPACGAYLRPDVVWFEESLPAQALAEAEDAARRCDLLLVVGTAGEVYPAAALPQYAKAAGAIVVEVNPSATPLSPLADHALRAPSGLALPALVRAAWGARGDARAQVLGRLRRAGAAAAAAPT